MMHGDDDSNAAASRAKLRPGLVQHEEQLVIGTEETPAGLVTVRKRVDEAQVREHLSRSIEQPDLERVPVAADAGDPGDVLTLPDGSVSIPVFEEELVVTRRLKVRERVIVRKLVEEEQVPVEARLRREHVDVDVSEEQRSARMHRLQ